MDYPKEISPCPIIDAICEIRFETEMSALQIYAWMYNSFKESMPDTQALPITNIPEDLRYKDPEFYFIPQYRFSNEDFVVQTGAKSIHISSFPNYCGWDKYSEKIIEVFNKCSSDRIIKSINRISLRYVNLFKDTDIFSISNFSFESSLKNTKNKTVNIQTSFETENSNCLVKILNNAISNNVKGSIFDISVSTLEKEIEFTNFKTRLDKLHNTEKSIFYDSLKPTYVEEISKVR